MSDAVLRELIAKYQAIAPYLIARFMLERVPMANTTAKAEEISPDQGRYPGPMFRRK
jgi:hypothetical protein